jgi:methanogenic corrinoid protein MtbC1
MLAKPVDVLDRIRSTALRRSGPHAEHDGISLPDDSPALAVKRGTEFREPGPPANDTGPQARRSVLQAAAPPSAKAPLDKHRKPARDAVRLARLIESEVVPRLVLSGRAANACEPVPEPAVAAPGPEDVVALVALVIADDAAAPLAYVEALRARGVPLERLYLDLFAVVAQRLGQLWTEGLCSFADVTVGLVRLQGLVREYSPAFLPSVEAHDPRRSALLLPAPGEQHTFGLAMVAEFFLRAGWEIHCDPMISEDEVSSTVKNRWFAVAGISVGNNDQLDAVAALIRRVRRESCNRVGGRVFAEKPSLAGLVGADATAADGRQAALQAETLLALLATRN